MRSPFLLGLASVFAGLTALLVVVSVAAKTPVTVVLALPLGMTALIMWYHATGRLAAQVNPRSDAGGLGDMFGPSGEGVFRPPRGDGGARRRGDRGRDGATATGRGRQTAGGRMGGRRRYNQGWYVDEAGQHWYVDAEGRHWREGPDGRRTHTQGTSNAGRVGGSGDAANPLTVKEACEVLGVSPDADDSTIKAAYREQVKRAHPDADDGDVDTFKRVTAAYERLSD